jgi:sRNA-binding protein
MTAPANQSTRPPFGRDFSAGAQHTLARLRRRYPGAFREVKPLALGIRDDILARGGFDHLELLHFFGWYSRAPSYLRAQAQPGAMRHDLDGAAVDPVSEENRAYAAAELDHQEARQRWHSQWLKFRAALLESATLDGDRYP